MNCPSNVPYTVSGSIVTFNNRDTIECCVQSLLNYSAQISFQLYIVDNGSTDGTPELIKDKFPQVKLIQSPHNLGFGKGHNQVLNHSLGDYHFIINPDTYLTEDVITPLVTFLENNSTTHMITPKILNPNGTVQYLPKCNPTISYLLLSKVKPFKYLRKIYTRETDNLEQPTEIDFCTGCFFGMPGKTFINLRGFDERYFMYFEDGDLSRQVRSRDFKIVYYPLTQIYHIWHRENTKNCKGILRYFKSMVIYFNKWGWRF